MPQHTSIPGLGRKYFHMAFPALTEAFGGDNCLSGITSAFDFLHTSKKEEMESAGESEGLIWIRITLNQLRWRIDSNYSVRRIQERLKVLIENGMVAIPSGQDIFLRDYNKPLLFLLNTERVGLLLARKIPPLSTVVLSDDKCHPLTNVTQIDQNPLTNVTAYKEREVNFNPEVIPPLPPNDGNHENQNPEPSSVHQEPIDENGVPLEQPKPQRLPKRHKAPKVKSEGTDAIHAKMQNLK